MKIWALLSTFFLALLTGCSGGMKPVKEFEKIQKRSQDEWSVTPVWKNQQALTSLRAAPDHTQPITLEDAHTLAMQHNVPLQAAFEDIGISQGDLVQAGFYSNPNVQGYFRPARKKDTAAYIEIDVLFSISDFWKVPLRKKVAEDDLTVKTIEIYNLILDVTVDVLAAYIECLYQKELVKIIEQALATAHATQKQVYYQYEFGYTNDLDKHNADSAVAEWESRKVAQDQLYVQAHIALRNVLGIDITTDHLTLSDEDALNAALNREKIHQSCSTLQEFALTRRPEIRLQQMKVARAKHTITYEKSRVFDNVQFGLSAGRDNTKKLDVGPYVLIDVPIFNTNYGAIESAKFELAKAQRELEEQRRAVIREVAQALTAYHALKEQITLYEKTVIPASKQAVEYAMKYTERMQLNTLVLLQAQKVLYERQLEYAKIRRDSALAFNDLESAIGTTILALQKM